MHAKVDKREGTPRSTACEDAQKLEKFQIHHQLYCAKHCRNLRTISSQSHHASSHYPRDLIRVS
eukprot:6179132-Pleurochrysis_carterae.AAC.1